MNKISFLFISEKRHTAEAGLFSEDGKDNNSYVPPWLIFHFFFFWFNFFICFCFTFSIFFLFQFLFYPFCFVYFLMETSVPCRVLLEYCGVGACFIFFI